MDEHGHDKASGDDTRGSTAERALRRSEELHRTTIDSLADTVHLVDRDLVILLTNEPFRAWCRSFGLSDQLVGLSVREAFPFLPERVDEEYRRVLSTGEPLSTEEQNDLDGRLVVTETRKVPFREEGEIRGVLTIMRDITQERELQNQLQHAHKMNALGQLAGGIAHDFNNVLGSIMGSAELLRLSDADFGSEERGYVEVILHSARRAADLVGKLLTFSRKAPKTITSIGFDTLAGDVVAMLGSTLKKSVTMVYESKTRDDGIMGDPAALESAILNMAINADHAMPEGGTLTLTTRNVVLETSHCAASPFDLTAGRHVEIALRDTGTGIPAEHLPRIFEPFFTTKGEGRGTGLGLSAVYRTVQEHRGEIVVETTEGAGTVFRMRLPCKTMAPVMERAKHVFTRRSGTILLVEDEASIRRSTSQLLERMGYYVLVANDGIHALEVFQSHPTRIDAVVTDMDMPRMSGRSLAERLIALDPEVRILIASGSLPTTIRSDHGTVEVLRKPFSAEELDRRLAQLLE